MVSFLDPKYAALVPYIPGEQPNQTHVIKLNTNESPYAPAPAVAEKVAQAASKLHLYPPVAPSALLAPLAQKLGVAQQQLLVGNGSDEILAFCFQAFCPNGAAFADLTYGFYAVYCRLYGINAKIVLLQPDFTLNIKDYAALGRTIFIANPNAPTGLALGVNEIEQLLQTNPDNVVIIDEAYVDFGAQTAVPLLQKYANLLVVGTFSKSRQLAGARLGYAAGSPTLIEDLNRIKHSFNPYSVNTMTIAAGAATLADDAYFNSCRKKVMDTRVYTQQKLENLGFISTISRANFVFVSHPAAKAAYLQQALRDKGIYVRWFNQPRIANYLRITIGTKQQMETLVTALQEILQQKAGKR